MKSEEILGSCKKVCFDKNRILSNYDKIKHLNGGIDVDLVRPSGARSNK